MVDTGYMMQDAGYRMNKSKSYQDLEIYSLAKELAVIVHRMTIEDLPKFEMYEEGNQIRRSSKSIITNVVEGFGRRRYKNEFIQFLTYAIASCDETKVHLEILHETGSLKKDVFEELFKAYEELGAKLFNFREAVIKGHRAS
ncbi:MAG TPA: four helix bundle protein [Thermodesulfobacteriota bacterium]|nr:four helix bundle protein [Thermodesulfobacteriota bacterium]